MTDLELLEMAAKAAGAEIAGMRGNVPIYAMPSEDDDGVTSYARWKPLEDDADAFRLAADLRLIVRCYEGTIIVDGEEISVEEHDLSDRHAACRRAITRAAAAIGRAQP